MTRLEKYTKHHGDTVLAQKTILEAAEATDGKLTADQDRDYKAPIVSAPSKRPSVSPLRFAPRQPRCPSSPVAKSVRSRSPG